EAGLVVTAEAPPEVADQPLEFQLGQLEAGLALEADGNRAEERENGEVGRVRDSRDREPDAARLNMVAPRHVAAGDSRQKGREGDILPPLSLLDALQGRPQSGLKPECESDGVVKGKSLPRFTADLAPLRRCRQLVLPGVNPFRPPEPGRAFSGGLLGHLL